MDKIIHFENYYDKHKDAIQQFQYLEVLYQELLSDLLEFCRPDDELQVVRFELVPTGYQHVCDWLLPERLRQDPIPGEIERFQSQSESSSAWTENVRAGDLMDEVRFILGMAEKVLKEYQ